MVTKVPIIRDPVFCHGSTAADEEQQQLSRQTSAATAAGCFVRQRNGNRPPVGWKGKEARKYFLAASQPFPMIPFFLIIRKHISQ